MRETEIIARDLVVADFDEHRLRASLEKLRSLTRFPGDKIMDPIQTICAAAGVAVVWVPELEGAPISGCARWLNQRKALIGLTLRYRKDDQVWFTLFHEIGHILLHRRKRAFVVDNPDEDLADRVVDPEMQRYEAEANRFSADTLIPPDVLSQFLRKSVYTNAAIQNFAAAIGVGPGIVVGRLQFEGVLDPHRGNALKQTFNWKLAG